MIFSASNISTWLDCNRKWGWTYLVKLRFPSTDSQSLGTEVHRQLEEYVSKGVPLDFTVPAGYLAQTALEHVPVSRKGLQTEREFKIQGRHQWIGYKDLETGNEVYDYKTTSSIAKWAKKEEDLLHDPQAVLYAYDNGYDQVSINWIYVQTKGPRKSKKVPLMMSREHAVRGFEVLEEIADEAKKALDGAAGLAGQQLSDYVLSLPFNNKHCEKFNGCPFRGLCNLSPEQRFTSFLGANK